MPDLHLVVDRVACAGHGLCYSTSPLLIESDDQGDPVVVRNPLNTDDVAAAEAAATVCPERALTVEHL